MAAAIAAGGHGVRTIILDEQPVAGGQIYRGVGRQRAELLDILGKDYAAGQQIVRDIAHHRIIHRAEASVWNVTRDGDIFYSQGGRSRVLRAASIVLATGAIERSLAFPGWTLPGVMGAGAAQVLLKSGGFVPQGNVVLAGAGPLLWLLAAQYLKAGVGINAMLELSTGARMTRLFAHAPGFVASSYAVKAISLLSNVYSSCKVIRGVDALQAMGTHRIEALLYRHRGREEMIRDVNLLLVHHGIIPSLNLPLSIGCPIKWDDDDRSWRPCVNQWGATGIGNIFLAGDGTGVSGALAARAQGTISGFSALHALGKISAEERDVRTRSARRELRRTIRGRSFFDELYKPLPPATDCADNTIVCRCEEITAGAIRNVVRQGCKDPNAVKSALRCGMGPCQGRSCGTMVSELVAQVKNCSPQESGYFRIRPPIKAVPLVELASLGE